MSGPVTPLEQRVLDLVEESRLVELTQRLVRAPGTNPPGEEAATIEALTGIADELGLAVTRDPVAPGRDNVVVRLAGGDRPGLMLLGHTDVVPVDDQWTRDPFGAELEDGRIYGRGATDMKGGLAACLVAMRAVQQAGVVLRGSVDLVALVDEEETGLGIRQYVGQDQPAYEACVVAEPTDLQVIVAARGDSYHEITVTGRAAHSGNASAGLNAVHAMAHVVAALERWTGELASVAHPLCGPATWSVGTITGGIGTSTVPDHCRISVDRRVMPGEDIEEVRAGLQERLDALMLVERGYRIETTMPMEMPGFETPAGHPLVTLASEAVVQAGRPPQPVAGWGPACDGGFVARDLGVPVVVLGPGSVNDQAHRPDESVGVDELVAAARAYVLMMLRLLG